MAVDMDPMVYFTAKMGKQMTGDPSEPTADELQVVRLNFLKSMEQSEGFEGAGIEELIESKAVTLPKGVNLIDADVAREELKTKIDLNFSFDHFEDTKEIRIRDPRKGGQGQSNPVEYPFREFRLVDDGQTVTMTTDRINPFAQMQQNEQLPPAMRATIARFMKGARFATRIDAPFEVVEHNATGVDGSALIWEYGFETATADSGQLPEKIHVRYLK